MISAILLLFTLFSGQEEPCVNFNFPKCVEKPCERRRPIHTTIDGIGTCGSGTCYQDSPSRATSWCAPECPSRYPNLYHTEEGDICGPAPKEEGSDSKLKSIAPDSVGSEEKHVCSRFRGTCGPCTEDDTREFGYIGKLYDCEWDKCFWNLTSEFNEMLGYNEELGYYEGEPIRICVAECPVNMFPRGQDCVLKCSERNEALQCVENDECYWDGTEEGFIEHGRFTCVDECRPGSVINFRTCEPWLPPPPIKSKGGIGDSVKSKLAWIIPSSVGGLVVLVVAGILIKRYVSGRRRSQDEEMEEGTGASGDAAPSSAVVLFDNPSQ